MKTTFDHIRDHLWLKCQGHDSLANATCLQYETDLINQDLAKFGDPLGTVPFDHTKAPQVFFGTINENRIHAEGFDTMQQVEDCMDLAEMLGISQPFTDKELEDLEKGGKPDNANQLQLSLNAAGKKRGRGRPPKKDKWASVQAEIDALMALS